MEIDLNLNGADEKSNSGGKEEGEEEEAEEMGGLSKTSICMELWHACAGPLISLPKKGSMVVYFPQGHIEQLSSSFKNLQQQQPLGIFDLSPQIFCRVLNVNLLADQETDEVFAQVTLVPEPEPCDKDTEDEENENASVLNKPMLHMFCKTLTASDTSTHGGFSVPRRAAEDCFPPLDYSQQRPSQELIAKDLHGVEWKFRHIYRGQPRRHLLTTGWSVFVSHKGLVSGDAVLFLRGENGELRLGIRRSTRKPCTMPSSVLSDHNVHLSVIAAATNAVATKSMFHIFYNPRTSPAEFIIPYSKYVKSCKQQLSVGTRFRMRFESEDTAEKRYTGIITAIEDIDPIKWPGSKWRSLKVEWDEHTLNQRQDKVSPWEIEPSIAVTGVHVSSGARAKRLRSAFPSACEVASPDLGGFSDFGESMRFSKVLQGQENVSLKASNYGASLLRGPLLDPKGFDAVPKNLKTARTESDIWPSPRRSDMSRFLDFGESVRFQKVLQGQENLSLKAPLPGFGVESRKQLWDFHDCNHELLERAVVRNGSWISSGRSNVTESPWTTCRENEGIGRMYSSQKLSPAHDYSFTYLSNSNKPFQKFNNEPTSQKSFSTSLFESQRYSSTPKTSILPGFLNSIPVENSTLSSPGKIPSWRMNCTPRSNAESDYLHSLNHESLVHLDSSRKGMGWPASGVVSHGSVNLIQPAICKSVLLGNNNKQTELVEISHKQFDPCSVSPARDTDKLEKQRPKLFGISLTEESPCVVSLSDNAKGDVEKKDDRNVKSPTSLNQIKSMDIAADNVGEPGQLKGSGRKSTKVRKQGSVVGRAIDLSKFDGYEQLICELERLFNMEGLLKNPDKGWQVVYTDNEDDVMLVGDDPWQDFCNVVTKILIYTHEEVQKLRPGMFNDDAVSCSDEQPSTVEVSKSSSAHQDSSIGN